MKKLRKFMIVLILSVFVSSALIPQKEKEADAAFVLTSAMVLGGLAVAAMGGIVSYANRDAIQDLGNTVGQKLTESGVNVGDMLSRNQYGMNNAMTNAIGESIIQQQGVYGISNFSYPTFTMSSNEIRNIPLPTTLYDNYRNSNNKDEFIIWYEVYVASSVALTDNDFRFNKSDDFFYTWGNYFNDLEQNFIFMNAHPDRVREDVNQNKFDIEYRGDYPTSVAINIKVTDRRLSPAITDVYSNLDTLDTPEAYTAQLDTVYNGETISVDYNRIEDIMTNSASEPLSLTNIETMVSSVESSIVDTGADTVGVLTTIWNGISGIPSLIQSSSTAVLGGISSLSDDLLTGLGTFTGNITAANDQLWTDAGAVWSGLVENINTANATRSNFTDGILDNVVTGLDNIKTGALTNGAKIGTNIETAATSVTDKVTSAATSITTAITDTVVPSSSAISTYQSRITAMNANFKNKFEFILLPMQSMKELFTKPKSLFDVNMVIVGTEIEVLPETFRPSINVLKPVLNGVVVLITFIGIYRKIQGESVV